MVNRISRLYPPIIGKFLTESPQISTDIIFSQHWWEKGVCVFPSLRINLVSEIITISLLEEKTRVLLGLSFALFCFLNLHHQSGRIHISRLHFESQEIK